MSDLSLRNPGQRRTTAQGYAIGGAIAAASGALDGALAPIAKFAVAKVAGDALPALSLSIVGSSALASAGIALALFGAYAVGSYFLSTVNARTETVFMAHPSRVYNLTTNSTRYFEAIPITYGLHSMFGISVISSVVNNHNWTNYVINAGLSSSHRPNSRTKGSVRFILCVGGGDYTVQDTDVRLGLDPIVAIKFTTEESNKKLQPANVNVVLPGHKFSASTYRDLSSTRVELLSNRLFNSAKGASMLRNRFDGSVGRAIFTTFRPSYPTEIAGESSGRNLSNVASPLLARISSPGEVVLGVTLSFEFLIRTINRELHIATCSDYIVTGTFIQAKADGTLINEDGTPVPLVDSNGMPSTVPGRGVYPADITAITGAFPFQHESEDDRTIFHPSYQVQPTASDPLPIFYRTTRDDSAMTDASGFTYTDVFRDNPRNVGFVLMDRRYRDESVSNNTLKYSATSSRTAELSHSELVPKSERVWVLMLTAYHIIYTEQNNVGDAFLRTSARLKLTETSVQKAPEVDSRLFFNSDFVNVSRYTFVEGSIPADSVTGEIRDLFNTADRNRINIILRAKLRTYRNNAWSTTTTETRSPVWAVGDILTSNVGGGLDHDLNLVGSEMETLANYYDAQKIYYDEVIDSQQSIIDLVNYIGRLFDFVVYQQGSRWRLSRDFYASNIDYLIFESDCIASIEASYDAAQENLPNVMSASYVESNSWTKNSITVEGDFFDPNNDKENATQIEMRGLTELTSVQTTCRSLLQKSRFRRHLLNVEVREIGMMLKPNDTIGFVHSFFHAEYNDGQVISSETNTDGVHFINTDTDTGITGIGKMIFRDELGRPTHQYDAERVDHNRFRIDGDLTQVSLITDPSRIRTSYSFTPAAGRFYDRCKILSVIPTGTLSFNLLVVIDDQRAYL